MKTSASTFALCAALAGLGLSACQPKPAEPTVGQRVDKALDSAGQAADKAKQGAQEMAQDAKAAGGEAMGKVEASLGDAAITASVNAELAKDPQLSALSINVDTRDGRVALKGKAPNAAARDRATQLAAAVKGVVSVDNLLIIDSRG